MTVRTHRPFSTEWAILLAIVLLGAGLRLWQIGALPPGLYQDEAYYGLDAASTARGDVRLYYPANNGREPLYVYLAALSISVLGRTPLAERLPAALVGIALIPATYALGRALFNRRLGLLSAAVVAFTFWPLALSRIGFRVGTLPLVTALSLACAVHGWRTRRLLYLALGGALYGLTFYTYLAARFTPLALIALGIFWYSAHRPTIFPRREGAAFFMSAALVAAPLAWLAVSQPALVFGRAEQVSLLSPAVNQGNVWGALFHNLWATLGMFLWRGDLNARHNWPGRPVFDWLMGAAFLVGVGRAAWLALKRRDAASALALIWAGVMLAPTLIADEAPHFLRASGVLPWICFFPALGWESVLQWMEARGRRTPGAVLVLLAFAASLSLTGRDYFGRYAHDPETALYFQSAVVDLAGAVNASLAAGRPTQLDRRLWDSFAAVRFLVAEPAALQLIESGAPLPAEGDILLWPYAEARATLAHLPPHVFIRAAAGPLYRGDQEPTPYSLFTTYRISPAPALTTPLAEFERGVVLQSAAITSTAGGLQVNLVWAARAGQWQTDGPDYHAFVQLWDGADLIAQDDGPLARGLYPTAWWRGSDVVLDEHWLTAPPGGASRRVLIGWYDFASGRRLRLSSGAGDFVEAPVP